MSKKVTNYRAGPRGINLVGGTTRWVEPGEQVEITTKKVDGKDAQFVDDVEIKGDLPDFGRKVDAEADAAAAGQVEALTAENEDLKKRIAALESDLEKATKPAK